MTPGAGGASVSIMLSRDSASRAWHNELLLRDLNERIEETSAALDVPPEARRHFVCECARDTCAEDVWMPADDYRVVRSNPAHFLVAKGHSTRGIERVIARFASYDVVERRPDDGHEDGAASLRA
jgi:hypothetical protein